MQEELITASQGVCGTAQVSLRLFWCWLPLQGGEGCTQAYSHTLGDLNSLLASFLRTLSEPRQAEIRKECLQLWGVSVPLCPCCCLSEKPLGMGLYPALSN